MTHALGGNKKEDAIMAKREMKKVNTEVVNDAETIVEDSTPEVEATPVFGFVADCSKLNVRNKPNAKSNVVCIIDKDTKVEIIEEESAKDFYKVKSTGTKQEFNGFCMKKYITIK